jgi:hypothetical protein
VTGEDELWTGPDDPPIEDFAADEEDEPQAGTRSVFVGTVRLVLVLLIVLALLVYFVVPFNSLFTAVPRNWRLPGTGTRTIPLAPEHKGNPMLPA